MSSHNQSQSENLLRLREVLQRFPVSRSTWYSGISEGRYPPPVRLGKRAVAWRESDIERLISDCSEQ
ncbi:MAG: AlpA family phage regulatory protein [bacterium]